MGEPEFYCMYIFDAFVLTVYSIYIKCKPMIVK